MNVQDYCAVSNSQTKLLFEREKRTRGVQKKKTSPSVQLIVSATLTEMPHKTEHPRCTIRAIAQTRTG